MEPQKIIPIFQHKKNNSSLFKYNNLSISEAKYNTIKNNKLEYETISLISKNTQSISTSPDDLKENFIKKSVSQKSINIVHILNRLSKRKNVIGNKLIFKIGRKCSSSSEKNINKIININQKGIKCKVNENKTSKNKNNDSKNNKNMNPKINNKIINNDKIGKIYKDNNSLKLDVKKTEKNILKVIPPKIIELFYNSFNISNNNLINKRNMLESKIPNVFINHLMLKNSISVNSKYKYLLLSTTNRIKGKNLTMLYYRPIKNIL